MTMLQPGGTASPFLMSVQNMSVPLALVDAMEAGMHATGVLGATGSRLPSTMSSSTFFEAFSSHCLSMVSRTFGGHVPVLKRADTCWFVGARSPLYVGALNQFLM